MDAALSQDGSQLLTVGADGQVLVTLLYVLHPQCAIMWHSAIACGFDLSSDGLLGACGDDLGELKLWNLVTKTATPLKSHVDEVYGCAFSPDSRTLCSSGAEPLVYVWDLSASPIALVRKLDLNTKAAGSVSRSDDLHYHPNGQLLAVGCKSAVTVVQLWNPNLGQLLRTLGLNTVHITPPLLKSNGPVERIFNVRWSPDGSGLAAAACQQGVARWSTATWDSYQAQPLVDIGKPVSGVAWAASGKHLAACSGCWTGAVVIAVLDASAGKQVWRREYPQQMFAEKGAVSWSTTSDDFIVAGGHHEVMVISAKDGSLLRLLPSHHSKGIRVCPGDTSVIGVFCTEVYSGGLAMFSVFASEGAMCDWEHYNCQAKAVVDELKKQPELHFSWPDHTGRTLAMHAVMKGRAEVLQAMLDAAAPHSYSVAIAVNRGDLSAIAALASSIDRTMMKALVDGLLQGKFMLGRSDPSVFWPLLQGVRRTFSDIFAYYLKDCTEHVGNVTWSVDNLTGSLVTGTCDVVTHANPEYMWHDAMLLPEAPSPKDENSRAASTARRINMFAKVLPLVGVAEPDGIASTQADSATADLLHLIVAHPPLPLEVYGYESVKALVAYKWQAYASSQARLLLGVHLIFVAAVSLFCIWLPPSLQARPINVDGSRGSVFSGFVDEVLACIVCLFVADLVTAYSIVHEVLQWRHAGFASSVRDVWNIMDVLSFVLIATINPLFLAAMGSFGTVSAAHARQMDSALIIITALESILLWSRVLYFLLAYQATGPLVRMILQIFRDIRYFMLLLACTMLGFAFAFYVLFNTISQNDARVTEQFSSLGRAMTSTFCIMVGMVDPSIFWKASVPALAIVMFCLYIVVMLVMLFNLLIAILSDSYEKVKETEQVEFVKGRAKIIFELEANTPAAVQQRFKGPGHKYLHFLTQSDSSDYKIEDVAWAGRLRETEKKVSKLLGAVEERLAAQLDSNITRQNAELMHEIKQLFSDAQKPRD